VDQERFDVSSLNKIKDDLVNKKLIHNKDTGVQSLVACCISDILRVYAPDAPYTDAELSEIFKLFIKMFKKLSDSGNGYYTQQVYLITRLAEVRSIILVTDIENSATLIESIFELFYDQGNTFNKKLEPIISDILIEIISEWDQITSSVLKLILNKFLSAASRPSTVSSSLISSSAQPFNFTLNICNANPDRLARQLTKFFSEVIYENNEEGEIDFKSLLKLHSLVVEIWRHVPEILASVMGLIDDELNADNEKYRILATETIGKILASQSRANFIQIHKDTWSNWMKKTLDISVLVRITWVEQGAEILVTRTDVITEITNGLSKTLIDTDERVRLSTIKALSNLSSDVLIRKVNSKTILNGLVQLSREKHADIREESIKMLGSLYREAYDDIYTDLENLTEMQKLSQQIPSQILNLYYINDKNINYLVDVTLLEQILPQEEDDMKRVERILNVMNELDERAKAAFIAFNKRQQQLSNVLSKFIEFCEQNNGGSNSDSELQGKIEKTINWLTVTLPDKYSPRQSLQRFVSINNRRLYYLIKICISPDSDYNSITNSSKELYQRLKDPKIINSLKGESGLPVKDIYNTFKTLIYRASLNIFSRSNIASLLKLSDDEKYSKIAHELINDISTITPTAFQNQIQDLVTVVKQAIPHEASLKVNTLRALFHIFAKTKEYLDNNDRDFLDKLIEFGKKGSPLEAKYAVKIIALSEKNDALSTTLFDEIYPLDSENEHFATHLASVSELFLTTPDIPEEKANEITPLLIKDVLLKNEKKGTTRDPAWIEDSELENGKANNLYSKILALEVFTNRLKSLDGSSFESDESITTIAENILKLHVSLIGNGGEIVSSKSSTYPTPKHYQARLRLAAGLNLLELAKFPKYSKLIKPSIIDRTILLIQDENETIRSAFIQKITECLKNEEISLKFIPAVYFIAYEPNERLKSDIKTWVKSTFKKRHSVGPNDIVFEKSITGLIYVIAHHAEFLEYIQHNDDDSDEKRQENLLKAYTFALEYIAFFLESIANEKNISLIYYLATRVKQYKDISFDDEAFDKNVDATSHIYRVSDLAQIAIKELQDHKGWTLQTYPGKIQLTSELFKPMKDSKEGQDVVSTSFIPEAILKRLRGIVKQKISSISTQKRVRNVGPMDNALKRVKIEGTKQQKQKPRHQREEDSDEDGLGSSKSSEPLRKSSRIKRISYTDQVREYKEGEDEDSEEGDDEEL
jgi:sister-chromatid-cohesion protein PDS5